MPQAVIFDVDGTLVDSVDQHARAWQDAFLHYGREVPFEDIRSQIGKGGDQLMPVFFSANELAKFGEEMQSFRTQVYRTRYMPQVKAFEGVRPLLERIKRAGMKIALASSADRVDFEHNLKLLKVGDLVDASTSAADAERSKPYPDIFEAALSRLTGTPAELAVAVGDTPYDAEAAAAIALPIIGLLCGGFPAETLTGAGCKELWKDPKDLLENYDRTMLNHR